MKVLDERETQKKQKTTKNRDRKEQGGHKL